MQHKDEVRRIIKTTLSIAPDSYAIPSLALSTLTFEYDDLCDWIPNLTKKDKAFIVKSWKAQSVQPKVKARSFREFSSRITQVAYSNEAGKCCIRGHDVNATFLPEFLRK